MTGNRARVTKLLIPWELREMGPREPSLPVPAQGDATGAPARASRDYAAANDADGGTEPSP